MNIRVYISTRGNACYAEAVYSGDVITVLPGGKISSDFAEHIRGGKEAKEKRNNPDYVDKSGRIIRECEFTSPSTAAQFITGRSTNGYGAWKVEKKISLGEYLKSEGLR